MVRAIGFYYGVEGWESDLEQVFTGRINPFFRYKGFVPEFY
jgi:hypothetical protein